MGISQSLTASIGATTYAIRNANDAIGVLQTAEGALAEVSSMLQRFKELATQGNNAALSSTQKGYLSLEMDRLALEVTATAQRTTFNTIPLLSKDATLSFQTGEATTGTVEVATVNITGSNFAKVSALVGETFTNPDGSGNASLDFNALQDTIDGAISEISTQRAKFGAQVNRLTHNVANLEALHENLNSANSRIQDTDYANETAMLTKTQILQQAATAMLSQANAQPNVVLALLK
jgi:flagellin